MLFEEMMRKEYKSGHDDGMLEGKLELITSFLSSRFIISDELSKKLQMISNEDALQNLLIAAAKAVSVEEFEKELAKVLPGQVESTEKI